MDLVLIAAIISCLLAVSVAIFGWNYKQAKDEVTKLLSDVIAVVENDEVSDEELQRIITQAKSMLKEYGLYKTNCKNYFLFSQ